MINNVPDLAEAKDLLRKSLLKSFSQRPRRRMLKIYSNKTNNRIYDVKLKGSAFPEGIFCVCFRTCRKTVEMVIRAGKSIFFCYPNRSRSRYRNRNRKQIIVSAVFGDYSIYFNSMFFNLIQKTGLIIIFINQNRFNSIINLSS